MSLSFKEELKLKSQYEMAKYALELVVRQGEALVKTYESFDVQGTSATIFISTAKDALAKLEELES